MDYSMYSSLMFNKIKISNSKAFFFKDKCLSYD